MRYEFVSIWHNYFYHIISIGDLSIEIIPVFKFIRNEENYS